MAITNRESFKNYCLRALGAPVLQINVSNEQVEDRIDDAFQKFWEFHADGAYLFYYKHVITEEDKTNGFIPLPPFVLSVLRVLPSGTIESSGNLAYQSYMQGLANSTFFSGSSMGGDCRPMTTYTLANSYIGLLQDSFSSSSINLRFNSHFDKIWIDTNWDNYAVGDYFVLECYRFADPADYPKIYNDHWLKRYATSLIKRQWGTNMKKYNGFQLPSGITLDGKAIFDEAESEIAQLHEELYNTYSLPPSFFMG